VPEFPAISAQPPVAFLYAEAQRIFASAKSTDSEGHYLHWTAHRMRAVQ